MTRIRHPGALPVFWQTLGLLLFGLLIAQGVGVALLLVLPPPRPEFDRMSDIAAALAGTPLPRDEREQPLLTRLQPGEPIPSSGLTAEAGFARLLAARLNVAEERVRLFSEPDRGPGFPFTRRPRRHASEERRHEPIFFGRLLAAVATPAGWRVAETSPPPLISPWQRRMILWFAVGALALVPLAWSFARALSRQIRTFADAADRLGADPSAPAVAEQGAAELRVAARALNRMQARLGDYVGERTTMIGAIAHDLRTPLARIAFRVEPAPEPLREKVLADVGQMQAMISATMGLVRTAALPKERVAVDLRGLVHALVEQERDMARAVSAGALAAATVRGDPLALERLIQNLIDNALAYGGAAEISLRGEAGMALLTVADRGPGLAPDLIERVFQPFARGDPSRNRATGGIGLGLTIARSIAEDHGGTLVLANRMAGGLEAVLRMPIAISATGSDAAMAARTA